MKKSAVVTVHMDPQEHERLEAEAKRRGISAGELAHELIEAGLSGLPEDAEERRRRGLKALERLRELTADLPPVDAVQVARQAREELEQRPEF